MIHVDTWVLPSAAMATKARHLKTPLQLWVSDNRKKGHTSEELAQRTGVTVDTARGWESRGRPSDDAIRDMERLFGVPAPRGDQAAGGLPELVVALMAQTQAMNELVLELRRERDFDVRLAAVEGAVALQALPSAEGSQARALPRVEAGSGRK